MNEIDGARHALYADDVTVWTSRGNLGQTEVNLQAEATIVQHYIRQGMRPPILPGKIETPRLP